MTGYLKCNKQEFAHSATQALEIHWLCGWLNNGFSAWDTYAIFKETKYSNRDLCLLPDRAIGRKGIEMIFWK